MDNVEISADVIVRYLSLIRLLRDSDWVWNVRRDDSRQASCQDSKASATNCVGKITRSCLKGCAWIIPLLESYQR